MNGRTNKFEEQKQKQNKTKTKKEKKEEQKEEEKQGRKTKNKCANEQTVTKEWRAKGKMDGRKNGPTQI